MTGSGELEVLGGSPTPRSSVSALRQLYVRLRTEGRHPWRQAGAVGCGIFVGMAPLYGLHLPFCIGLASLFRLNQITTYLAAHVGNPLSALPILYVQIQVGHWVRTGAAHPRRLSAFEGQAGWDIVRTFSGDLLVGVPLVGGVAALLGAAVTYAICRRQGAGTSFDAVVECAAARYLTRSVFGWEWVRAKLRIDPVYRTLLEEPGLVRGRVLDLGCGRGHLLALLDEGRVRDDLDGLWTTLFGVEHRVGVAKQARVALGRRARIVTGDMTVVDLPQADTCLLLDVLHYVPAHAQAPLVRRVTALLAPGGVLLVREADRRWRPGYFAVVVAERICAWARRDWKSRHYYRASAEWAQMMEEAGLVVEGRAMGAGTPFANILIVGRRET